MNVMSCPTHQYLYLCRSARAFEFTDLYEFCVGAAADPHLLPSARPSEGKPATNVVWTSCWRWTPSVLASQHAWRPWHQHGEPMKSLARLQMQDDVRLAWIQPVGSQPHMYAQKAASMPRRKASWRR